MERLPFPDAVHRNYCPMCTWIQEREHIRWIPAGEDKDVPEEHLRWTCQCGYSWATETKRQEREREDKQSRAIEDRANAARAEQLRLAKIEQQSRTLLRPLG